MKRGRSFLGFSLLCCFLVLLNLIARSPFRGKYFLTTYWATVQNKEEAINYYLETYGEDEYYNNGVYPNNESPVDAVHHGIVVPPSGNRPKLNRLPTGNSSDHCQDVTGDVDSASLGNSAVDETTANTFIRSNSILDIDQLLSHTMCHETSRFRTTTATVWNTSNRELVNDWELKLIFLAIHDFHHRPARGEHHDPPPECSTRGNFDYKCSDAKYLVSSIPNLGMGAAFRLGAVAHVIEGIAANRIPLFVANTPMGPKHLQEPWQLSSCQRRDMQCVFLPTSPCTIQPHELDNATTLQGDQLRQLRRTGQLPPDYEHLRVVVVPPIVAPANLDKVADIYGAVRNSIHERAMKLINELKLTSSAIDEQQLQVLEHAASQIQKQDMSNNDTSQYEYGHRYFRIAHAVLLYLLRPNDASQQLISQQMNPSMSQLDPADTIGMPIRGSDKCGKESTCLSFRQHMQLARETWEVYRQNNESRGSLILTTEDRHVFNKRLVFGRTTQFPLDFVVNEHDVLQGSGRAPDFSEMADTIMLNSLVALKMQFHAGHVYGNCCSNFHTMLFDLLGSGCGTSTPTTTCLQETKDYNVCCAWTRSEQCDILRRQYQAATETEEDRYFRLEKEKLHLYMANRTQPTT